MKINRKFIFKMVLISILLIGSMSFLLVTNVENNLIDNNLELPLNINAANISINGNAELAANASSGYGNSTHPYIIENYVISGSGGSLVCIEIHDTDAHFILRNCTVYDGSYGILFDNVTNGEVRNNTVHDIIDSGIGDQRVGIYLYDCDNNTLIDNAIHNIIGHDGGTPGGEDYTGNGIYLDVSNNNTLINNTVYDTTTTGIAGGTDYSGNGICLDSSNNNTLTNNTIHDSSANIMGDCSGNGILLISSIFNRLTDNTIYNNFGGSTVNTGNGIVLYSNCNDNTLTDNRVYNNSGGGGVYAGNGIVLYSNCNNNTLTYNRVYNNSGGGGLYYGNGIVLYTSDDNDFIQNKIINNTGYGVDISQSSSDDNYFHNNIIWENYNQIPTFTNQVFDIGTNTTWVFNIYNPETDDDSDGLSNVNETTLGTSPFQADTDGDGLNDGDEINGVNGQITDAIVADTDGDGLSDGAEVLTLGTNATNGDSDGDGYSDGDEIAAGTNPLDPGDYPGKPTPTDDSAIIITLVIAFVIGVSALSIVSTLLFMKNRELGKEIKVLKEKFSYMKSGKKKSNMKDS